MGWRIGLLVLALSSAPAFACRSDVDCVGGSKCQRPQGSLYGICVGGRVPGATYDRQPATDIQDPYGTVGRGCSLDSDCGLGNRCVKGTGTYGVCVSKNPRQFVPGKK